MKDSLRTISARARGIGIIAITGYFLSYADLYAQGLYNESTLYINGADLHVDGEVQNPGFLQNDGVLTLTGDWDSQGKYSGKGILEVNGNMPQRISHHDQDVSSLRINGWGTKYIKGTIDISEAFFLNKGIVEVTTGNVFRLREKAVITGGHAASYVDGAITVGGTGYKFFPVGKNGTYAPIEFLNVKGEIAEFSVEVFENPPVVSVENIIVGKGLYWHRKDRYGKFGGSPVAVAYNPRNFQDPDKILLLTGTDWDGPFSVISELEHSREMDKISTHPAIYAPLIMLGQISKRWKEADFYFSTALSPHASYAENRKVKIFGKRLREGQFQFQVFNRRGELVYENQSLEDMKNNGWDGRNTTGKELASGTYPYRLVGFGHAGEKIEKQGVITIIY